MWKWALATAAAVVSADIAFPEEDGVLVLSADNFDEALSAHKYIVVEFFAPWCGHCKQLAPEYAKAAREMKASAHPIPFAKIDATNHTTIAERYDVQGFPTIKLFSSGGDIEFSGGRSDSSLMAWVRKKTGQATVLLTEENYDETIKREPIAVGCFAEGSAEAVSFEAAAKEIADCNFAHAFEGSTACTKMGATAAPFVKVFGPGEEITTYSGDFTELDLSTFVKIHRHPVVIPFSGEVSQDVFEDGRPLLFYFRSKHDVNQDIENAFANVAKDYRNKVLFSTSGVGEPMENRLMDYIAVMDADPPTIRLVKDPIKGMTKYKMEGDITEASIRQFVEDFFAARLTSHLRSQPAPATNNGPIMDLVGKTFPDVVMDPTKDVLVEFYAPWCGHCKKFEPTYAEFARKITSSSNQVVVARMDVTQNDVDGLDVSGFPTLRLWRADRKSTVLEFDQDRSVENLVDWMEEHGSYTIAGGMKTEL